MIWNATKSAYRFFISSAGKVAIGTNAAINKFTVVETTPGNAWAAASFTNTSTVGFGIEVTGGNEDNSIAVFKNYANIVGANLSGRGELFVKDWIASNAGTSASGKHHFRMENNHLRFSFLLEEEETGVDNAGSNFSLRRYNDAGDELGEVLQVIRSNGNITFYGNAVFNSNITVNGVLAANNTDIPLHALSDVSDSALPNIEGGILRVVNGVWDIADVNTLPQPDLSPYLTKPIADTYYASLSNFNSHINNLSNPHQVSLEEVLTVNNFTTIPIISNNYISTPSLIIEDVTVSAVGTVLTIDGNLTIEGNTVFNGSVNLNIFQLVDVDDQVELAPDGYVLKKVSGIWKAVPDPDDTPIDLSNYYTKSEADNKFVDVTGDSMTGALSITSATTALKLTTPEGISSISLFYTGQVNPSLSVDVSSTATTISMRDADSLVIKKLTEGNVVKINDDGSLVFGDSTKSSSTLGNIAIQAVNPSISLQYNGTPSGNFDITNKGSYTDITEGGIRVIALNAGANPNVELFYGNSRKMRTVATGIEVFDTVISPKITLDGLPIYKSADGKLVIDADVVITGVYKEEWTGVGTGTPPGAEYLTDLADVSISSIAGISVPFLLGRSTSTGNVTFLTMSEIITTLNVVEQSVFDEHVTGDMHLSEQDRLNLAAAYDNISMLYNWDIIYSSHTSKEVGLSDTGESGSGISTNNMKYIFYWSDPGGDRFAIKTRFADNADALHNKPWDEFRYSRALGFSALPASALYSRGLYDLGTVHAGISDVPEDGSWQIETIDSSYIYNQNATEQERHKYQLATKWVDRDTSFSLWARGRDGSTQQWLPWVQFLHSGNTPQTVDLYPTLPTEAYDELENEDNWTYDFSTPDDPYELYIGETEGIDWAFNIGHRVVNKQYIYEVTPIGIRRLGNTKYTVQEVTTTGSTTTLFIEPIIDRYELTMLTASNNIDIVIRCQREKPIVISVDNQTAYAVTLYYSQVAGPNVKLLDMEPDVIVEVHPGIWQLN